MQPWQSFYVIVGGAAGALTGLQFVVMALIADLPIPLGEMDAANAFATPTITHFVAVLLVAISSAVPWTALWQPIVLWGGGGLCGLLYMIAITRRMLSQTKYRAVLEDWIFHAVVPALAYLSLIIVAALLSRRARAALFLLAAASVGLLIAAIHNAWDNTTFLVLLRHQRPDADAPAESLHS